MATTRKAFGFLAAAGLALAGVGAASGAASATENNDVCRLTVHSVKAQDLSENNGDETFLRLGDTTTPVRNYADNQKRNNIGSDDFVGSERVRVIEDDPGAGNDDPIGQFTLPCESDTGETLLTGSNSIYKVRWSVLVLP
jgi:hypothetical protein